MKKLQPSKVEWLLQDDFPKGKTVWRSHTCKENRNVIWQSQNAVTGQARNGLLKLGAGTRMDNDAPTTGHWRPFQRESEIPGSDPKPVLEPLRVART